VQQQQQQKQQQQQQQQKQQQLTQQLQQQLSLGPEFSCCSSSWSTPRNSFEMPLLPLTPSTMQPGYGVAAAGFSTTGSGSSPCVINAVSAGTGGNSSGSSSSSVVFGNTSSGIVSVDLLMSQLMDVQLQGLEQTQQQHVFGPPGGASVAGIAVPGLAQSLGQQQQQQQQQRAKMLAALQQVQYWKAEEARTAAQLQATNDTLQGVLSLLQASQTDAGALAQQQQQQQQIPSVLAGAAAADDLLVGCKTAWSHSAAMQLLASVPAASSSCLELMPGAVRGLPLAAAIDPARCFMNGPAAAAASVSRVAAASTLPMLAPGCMLLQ
jgi:hypothetical protein